MIPMKDYFDYVYFEDGKIVSYDMSKMIEKEAFRSLRDINIFVDTCTIMNDTLVWDIGKNRDVTMCLDIGPDTLYELLMAVEKIA